jgi:ESS family glutamate:Na+ symporter
MPEAEISIVTIEAMDGLSISIVVLFIGMFLNRHVRILGDNYIPPAVTGGLLFSLGAALLYSYGDIQLDFEMRFRDLLLLVFFSTVGLSAKLSVLLRGGKALLMLIGISALFLIVQDLVGVAVATLSGYHPGYGLMAGSISFAGGHGTAIAWGAEAEAAGLSEASMLGVIFATLGLVAGGLLGGPIARWLILHNEIESPGPRSLMSWLVSSGSDTGGAEADGRDRLFNLLTTLLILSVCVSVGDVVNRFLFAQGVLLPGFLTAMGVAIVITNLMDVARRPIHEGVVEGFAEVSLNVFLSMSMISLQLWLLANAAGLVLFVLFLQILVMGFFAVFVVFRYMGRNYDAVVIAAGFAGLGLGATPVAIANMDAVTTRYGPSPKAFLVVPLIGAFFIDILNASVIKFFIAIITGWVGFE